MSFTDYEHDDGHGDDQDRSRDRDQFVEREPKPEAEKSDGEQQTDTDDTYKVGYRRPPKHSRVVKGQVLNPRGRPKGSKNKPQEVSKIDYRAMILRDGGRMIAINEAGQRLTLTAAEAVRRAQFISAMKGNVRAQRSYLELLARAEREKREEREAVLLAVGEYKLKWAEEFEPGAGPACKGRLR